MARKKKDLHPIPVSAPTILFRNLSGIEGDYNAAGDRNFCIVLNKDTAEAMVNDGWNIRWLKPQEEGDSPTPYIQVKASFKNPRKMPHIVLVTSRGKTVLNEETINLLDWADIEHVDLIINPSEWEIGGKSGVKGYVKEMYVTVHESEFEKKYYDVPQTPVTAIGQVGGCGECEECDGSCA